jgi:hypothetical protein
MKSRNALKSTMRRMCCLGALLLVASLPVGGLSAGTKTRVVTKRYSVSPLVPNYVVCPIPGGFWWVGFGPSGVSFPVERGERTVDIRIDDDLHDNAIGAFVTQSPKHYPGPEATGTWICGSKKGIVLTSRRPVKVYMPQTVTAPTVKGSVRATFHR